MVKRVISEEERERRAEYQRLYRAEHRQDKDWMAAEAARKKRYYVPKKKKTPDQLRAYNRKYKELMRTRRAAKKLADKGRAQPQHQPVRSSRRARHEPPEQMDDGQNGDVQPIAGPSRAFRRKRFKTTPQREKYFRHRGRLMRLTKKQMAELSTSEEN